MHSPSPCAHISPLQDAAAKLKAAESSQATLKADLAKARGELDRVRARLHCLERTRLDGGL